VKQDCTPCQVQINGTPQQVKAAAELVKRVILEGPTAIHINSLVGGPSIQVTMDCPQALVGRVIGSAGATIKELQARSGARIQIDQSFPDGVPRKINISGSQTAVTLATQLVSYVMENGPALPGQQHTPGGSMFNTPIPAQSPYGPPSGIGGLGMGNFGMPQISPIPVSTTTSAGGVQTHVMECAKPMVGRIIGRGGETINILQQRSGAKMQIDQSTVPCKINITGTPQSIALGAQLITELIQTGQIGNGTVPQNMNPYGMPQAAQSYPGYPPQNYGMPQQMMPPTQYGYPPQQQQQQMQPFMQQQYAQAYGNVPQVTGAYGQPQHMGYGGVAATNPAVYPQTAPQVAVQKPLPSPWSEHKTEDGNTYWYNSTTGVSQVSLT
jgi:far upstream element-binding protein